MVALGLLAGLLWAGRILAQQDSQPAAQVNPSWLKGMKWRLIGPFRGGRSIAVAGIAGNPEVYYFGGASGGVWKTTDGGVNWQPMFDKEPVSSIGAIAVAPSDPNVIYVGTGEACIRGDISHGDGVYKSVDGGQTWKNVGLKDTQTIGAVMVDPKNPDVVLVAALGHVYGPNAERGVFRTTDGGKTWTKTLFKDDKTGAIAVAFAPSNAHLVYAALWEANRTAWGLTSGGPGSGLYRSEDEGATWKEVKGKGWPEGILGRMGVSVSGADPNRVYVLVEAKKGGLYRSDDGGKHWKLINKERRLVQRSWYYMHIFADPKSVDTLYVLDVGAFRSTDGGKTFTVIHPPHGDNHALWIDPMNPNHMILGNDGGVTISLDSTKTWTPEDNQPTAQFYHVIADNRFNYYVYGAQQDNSTVGIASRTDHGYIGRQDWYSVGGGESGTIAPDPRDPNIVYAGGYQGELTRYNHRTGEIQEIGPWPEVPDGEGSAIQKYRFQWTAPTVISPHDPNVIYHGGQMLFKSTNSGMSWTVISPDLTRNDKSKQIVSGGPITKDDTGTEFYDTIFAIAESPTTKGQIWVGSDDGLVHLTRDGGKTWTDVTPKQMPEWSRVDLIEASPSDAATAYLAIDRHKLDDLKPYIYVTRDYGKSWSEITNGIPATSFVHTVREDPVKATLLYAGTETGVFVSFDAGAHWQTLQSNLPPSPVRDLIIKDDDLVAATHGRAFWILDDITPLRQSQGQPPQSDVYLFKPRLTYRTHRGGGFHPHGPVGQNPPNGAIVYFYLRAKPMPKQAVTLEFLDSNGKVVRRFSSLKPQEKEQQEVIPALKKSGHQLPAKAGLNRFVWDLRYEDAAKIDNYNLYEYESGLHGPLAEPGDYQVKLTAAGKTLTAPLTVKLDPRLKATQADLEKQLQLALAIRTRLTQIDNTVNQAQSLEAQLVTLTKDLAGQTSQQGVVKAANDLDTKLKDLVNTLIDPEITSSEDSLNYPIRLDGKYAVLEHFVESADHAPTQQSFEVFQSLNQRLDPLMGKWDSIRTKDLTALNDMMRKAKIPALRVAFPAGREANGG